MGNCLRATAISTSRGCLAPVMSSTSRTPRQGFAYGTLKGHPERGEESFVIERDVHTGTVTATVRAFSRPGRWSTKLLGPIGRLLQSWMTNRYLNAL